MGKDSQPDPKELDCTMGTIAYALNGVGFFSGAVSYVRGGDCPQLDVSDPEAEWISFDCCTGHSTGDGLYHYHFPPTGLLASKFATVAPRAHTPPTVRTNAVATKESLPVLIISNTATTSRARSATLTRCRRTPNPTRRRSTSRTRSGATAAPQLTRPKVQ